METTPHDTGSSELSDARPHNTLPLLPKRCPVKPIDQCDRPEVESVRHVPQNMGTQSYHVVPVFCLGRVPYCKKYY